MPSDLNRVVLHSDRPKRLRVNSVNLVCMRARQQSSHQLLSRIHCLPSDLRSSCLFASPFACIIRFIIISASPEYELQPFSMFRTLGECKDIAVRKSGIPLTALLTAFEPGASSPRAQRRPETGYGIQVMCIRHLRSLIFDIGFLKMAVNMAK